MQSIEPEYFKKKAQELRLDRADLIKKTQAWLDEKYPGQTRVAAFNQGVLKIITPSASMASELRLSQVAIIARFRGADPSLKRLQIVISSLAS